MSTKSEIRIGWSKRNITPSGPTMLAGQMGPRLATEVLDPLYATVLAIESANGEQNIMISVDLVAFDSILLDECRKQIARQDDSIDIKKVWGSATHTHTAPQFGKVIPVNRCLEPKNTDIEGRGNCGIDIDEMRKKHPNFVDSEQYFQSLIDNISDAVIEAWQKRKAGFVAWGYGTAAVGECRRLSYSDSKATMYGPSWDETFWNAEGHVDHSVNMLFTYDKDKKITGMVLNLACPSQVSEIASVVSADFWNEVRTEVAATYGKDVYVLPQCSAAGDQSPHKLIDMRAEARMLKLKGFMHKDVESWIWKDRAHNHEYNIARRKEIGSRIIHAVKDAFPYASKDMRDQIELKHIVDTVEMETRQITKKEADEARKTADNLEECLDSYNGRIPWLRGVVKRYENQKATLPMETHIIRLGDIAFASNRFEYYLDFGDRLKGRSAAEQTFIVQLAGSGTYLSCARNNAGGSYGSGPASCLVSAEGGQQLLEATLTSIKKTFDDH